MGQLEDEPIHINVTVEVVWRHVQCDAIEEHEAAADKAVCVLLLAGAAVRSHFHFPVTRS